MSHFIATEDEELTGQPYAFDLVSFGPRCALTQLTRYTYRNLIEGRPLYDNIQVVNGAIIDPRGAQETKDAEAAGPQSRPSLPIQRACGPGEEGDQPHVQPVRGDDDPGRSPRRRPTTRAPRPPPRSGRRP